MTPPPQIDPDAASRIMAAIAAPESADPQFPTVDGYTIGARLGAGGAGEVYRGFRLGSDRPVAIKLMRKSRPQAPQDRAWRELEVLAQLRLPSLPRVLDYGICAGRMYIVTELVDGRPLHEHTRGLGLRERVALLARIADAVQGLHEHGVIHRDVKPSNIMIDRAGNPVIIDFGIATLLGDEAETLTQEGAPIGTPAFMAPEQARGERRAVSTRTDIYGLGATAFSALVGATPHDTGTTLHEAIRRVAQDPPREVRSLEPSLPRDLAAVLMKSVAREPGGRYASAALLAMDLRRWLAGERVSVTPTPRLVRLLRRAARYPIAATVLASTLIAGAIVGGSMGLVWYVNGRPAEVEVDRAAMSRVRLKSEGGRTLHLWDAGTKNGIIDAKLLRRDAAFGGGRLVLVAFSEEHEAGLSSYPAAWAGLLCAFDASRPAEPLWTNHVALLPELRYAAPISGGLDEFRPGLLGIADVFPERPGQEIILVSYHRPYSPTAIQVLDQSGELLYEAWHDGYLHSMHWMPGARLLVLAGSDADGRWDERGEPARTHTYPQVVMAIRPRLGESGLLFSAHPRSGAVRPAWYHALLPGELTDHLREPLRVGGPYVGSRTGRLVQVTASAAGELHGEIPQVHWIFDEAGGVVETVVSTPWKRAAGLPRAESLYFGLPPARRADLAGDIE
jgi:predicted Ser/Thr protein kinase